jgi:hypothetical protein
MELSDCDEIEINMELICYQLLLRKSLKGGGLRLTKFGSAGPSLRQGFPEVSDLFQLLEEPSRGLGKSSP